MDKALARHDSARDEAPVTIEIADGPAVPRPGDPGLYSAWKVVMVAVPCLLWTLCTFDYTIRFLADCFLTRLDQIPFVEKWCTQDNYYRQFIFFMPDGLLATFKITCYSIIGSLCIGIIVGLCRVSKVKIINFIASVYVEVVRGIPLFVQLFFIYYAIASFVKIPATVTAVIAMSLCYGAYMGEVVRSGIEAIDRGQQEAAMSLGFTPFQSMIYVILPQAIRTILPPVGNECIALLKDSSMISVLAVPDLMRRATELVAVTYASFEIYSTVALVYLFVTLILSKLVSKLETRMGRYERR